MAKRKKGAGPSLDKGVAFTVIPATKKALTSITEEVRAIPEFKETEFVSVSPQQFAGSEKGESFLLEISEKWEDSYCPYVTIRDISILKTAKAVKLREKISSEEMSLESIKKRTDAGSFKSKLAGCASCESKVNRKYIKDSICPVCGVDMRAPSAAASIEKKEENLRRLRIKLSVELADHAGEAPLRYLVAVPKAAAVK